MKYKQIKRKDGSIYSFPCEVDSATENLVEENIIMSELCEQIEDLKCCGNCEYDERNLCGNKKSEFYDKIMDSRGICKDWQHDGLTQGERK